MSRMKRKSENIEIMDPNRIYILALVGTSIMLLLLMRLFYIQFFKHELYLTEVNKQRLLTIPFDSGRGAILDRNYIPLTDRVEATVAVIFPQLFIISEDSLQFLEDITGVSKIEVEQRIKSTRFPFELRVQGEIDWEDRKIVTTRGVFIINKKLRYEDRGLLSHLIGYINQVDKKGTSGIEKAMDPVLIGRSGRSLAATVDGRKRFLPGEGYSIVNAPLGKRNVRLTIDYILQSIVEEAMNQVGRDGAVVVSKVKTGEILAMVSRPNFNPNLIAEHLKSSGDELYNKVIQMAFPPGSVFKIVVAVEAIERGVVELDDLFFCSGSEKLGEIEIKCSSYNRGGHGEITFEKAFAESCNSVFIQLAQQLGAENIMKRARNLGLGSIVDIGIGEEQAGSLPMGDELLGPAIGNIAIGQGSIETTPLQVNQLTQIIANRGVKKPLYLLDEIIDEDYNLIEKLEDEREEDVLPREVAEKILYLMEKVTQEGTAKIIGELGNITAGKTGTAQSSSRGEAVLHAWFTGYFPTNDPKYAITVFIQNGGAGRYAIPVFKEIVEKMMDTGY